MKPPTLFEIPKGTPATRCTCGRTMFKVRNPKTGNTQPLVFGLDFTYNGQTVPVIGSVPPSATMPGKGWNHFLDCPDRDQHRRRV